jgi:hypothetical protein
VRANPRYDGLLKGPLPSIKAIQARVPARTLYVEFFELPNALAVWAIDGESVTTLHVPMPRKELADRIHALAEATATGQGDWKTPAVELYQQLFSELSEPLQRADHLVLVPGGALSYLPFGVLTPDAATAPASCLALHTTLSYAPSARTWLSMHAAPSPGLRVLVGVDGDRPGNVLEASTLANLGPHGTLLTGPQASRDAVLHTLKEGSLVHLAVVVRPSADAPLYSSLLLGDNTSLSLVDWLGLRTRPSLVCMTGSDFRWSPGRLGDQALAASEAVLAGGDSALLLSAWSSPTEHRLPLLTGFYQHLAEGQSGAVALHAAIVDVVRTHPEPGAWAWLRYFGSP